MLGIFWYGWNKEQTYCETSVNSNTYVSVIIAFRNEAENLPQLLSSLNSQSYPKNKFEILLINDHSTDNSVQIIETLHDLTESTRIIHLPDIETGKKAAVIKGVSEARGELLLFTDADCILPQNWIKLHSDFYNKHHKPSLIIGMVSYLIGNGYSDYFLELELQSLVASAFGAAGINHPIMCNGANLAVKSSVYKNINIKNHLASGDDMFLLSEIKKNDRNKISMIKDPGCIVKTKPVNNIPAFFNQRIRWASKSRHYNDRDIIISGLVVFLINTGLLYSMVLSVVYLNILPFSLVFGLKTLTDILFLNQHLKFIGQRNLLCYLPLFQFIYPLYAVFFGFLGLFIPFNWKGRLYK